MAKRNVFDDLEEFVDEEIEYEEEIEDDEEESYKDFINEDYEEEFDVEAYYTYDKVNYSSDDDYDEYEEGNGNVFSILTLLGVCANWFIRLGVAIAIILLIFFFITGKVTTALLYIVGLTVSFFFGYGFMWLIDHLFSNAN